MVYVSSFLWGRIIELLSNCRKQNRVGTLQGVRMSFHRSIWSRFTASLKPVRGQNTLAPQFYISTKFHFEGPELLKNLLGRWWKVDLQSWKFISLITLRIKTIDNSYVALSTPDEMQCWQCLQRDNNGASSVPRHPHRLDLKEAVWYQNFIKCIIKLLTCMNPNPDLQLILWLVFYRVTLDCIQDSEGHQTNLTSMIIC